ncbi:MAG: hypothetical protein ACE5JX_09765 [Acidobacteriota bacterium]
MSNSRRRSQLQPAVDYYHELISRDLAGAHQQGQELLQKQKEQHVLFGDRPMATSLRPTFLSELLYTDVQDSVYLLRQAILKIAAKYFNDRSVLVDDLGMEEWEIELASIPTSVIRLSATARMDSFMTEDSFKFVEVNAEVPAGPAYLHQLGKIYRTLPIFQEFERTHPVRFISPLEHLVANLLRTYHEEFDGKEAKPTFAIVDLDGVPTHHEFLLIQEYLENDGYRCLISDPRALECLNGWIYAGGQKIDILYRRLLMNEFYRVKEDCQPYMQGYLAQKTCFINSFRTKLVHKKAILALLSDESYQDVLNSQQLDAVQAYIPWTRRLRERKTRFRGLNIDLMEFVRANRKYFVIKPNDEYGGKGVLLGFDATQLEWEQGLKKGLNEGFVVQECVNIHREPFLKLTDGSWRIVPVVVDLDPYINGPLVGGCLTRISSSNLANVTAGGGTLPSFILRYVT